MNRMLEDNLLEILNKTVGKQLSKDICKIDENANLFDYGLDSIGFINIIMELEKSYNIFIDEDDLDLDVFNNVAYIREYLNNKKD